MNYGRGREGRDRRDGHDAAESSPCRHSLEHKISRSLLVLFRWLCMIGIATPAAPHDETLTCESSGGIKWSGHNTASRSTLVLQKAYKQCKGKWCGAEKPLSTGFRRQDDRHLADRCFDCEYPSCKACGHTSKTIVRETDKDNNTGDWYCEYVHKSCQSCYLLSLVLKE